MPVSTGPPAVGTRPGAGPRGSNPALRLATAGPVCDSPHLCPVAGQRDPSTHLTPQCLPLTRAGGSHFCI